MWLEGMRAGRETCLSVFAVAAVAADYKQMCFGFMCHHRSCTDAFFDGLLLVLVR